MPAELDSGPNESARKRARVAVEGDVLELKLQRDAYMLKAAKETLCFLNQSRNLTRWSSEVVVERQI